MDVRVNATPTNTWLWTTLHLVFNSSKYLSEFLQYINRMGVCSCCWRGFFFLLVFKIREKTRSLWLGSRKGNASDLHILSVCTNRYTHTLRHSNDLIFRSYACRVPLLVPGSPPSCTFSSFRKTGMASLGLVLSSRELPSSVICSSIASNDPWSVITARNRSSDSSGALAWAQCTQHRGRNARVQGIARLTFSEFRLRTCPWGALQQLDNQGWASDGHPAPALGLYGITAPCLWLGEALPGGHRILCLVSV